MNNYMAIRVKRNRPPRGRPRRENTPRIYAGSRIGPANAPRIDARPVFSRKTRSAYMRGLFSTGKCSPHICEADFRPESPPRMYAR